MLIRSVKVRGLLLLLSFIVSNCPRLFAQNSQVGSTPPSGEVPLFVIVVRSPDEGQEILERLKRGESFTGLAREKSIDPTAEAGGYMGMFSPAALRSGMLAHTMHTAVIDRHGRLVTNLEGNEFSAEQLSNLLESMMDRKSLSSKN
jgi:hypothetical protein